MEDRNGEEGVYKHRHKHEREDQQQDQQQGQQQDQQQQQWSPSSSSSSDSDTDENKWTVMQHQSFMKKWMKPSKDPKIHVGVEYQASIPSLVNEGDNKHNSMSMSSSNNGKRDHLSSKQAPNKKPKQ
eukprot:m.226679 g.226679  ORF g.226679 m.226679 type:complete len:127 (-) comp13866_c0_seq6:3467-3847(-)